MRRQLKRRVLHLPWATNAQIPLNPTNKLKDYVLCPDHPKGGDKARWFRSALGIERDDWEYLHDQVLDRLPNAWVCDYDLDSRYGAEFGVAIDIDGRNGSTCEVLTGWLVEVRGDPAPTLTTVLPRGRRDSTTS
jgi:filamentous hemagglutinin